MPCYHPLPGWYSRYRNESGKRGITFKASEGFKDRPVQLPCGKCIGCLLEKSRQWAMRCMHEAKLYERNCFITLTYDDANLPAGGSLVPEHYVLFMKKLRWKYGEGIRFFHCGEYGEKFGRPHHHALLFNHGFDDRESLGQVNGRPLWRSDSLDKLWSYGFCSIGECTFESASYVARYTMKKYGKTDADYGGRVKEYLTMSRKPGIGRGWLDKFYGDVFPRDEVVVNGKLCKPPRYYDTVCEKRAPSVMERIKRKRRVAGKLDPDSTGRRLLEREVVKRDAISTLSRKLEV